ncbi:MAG: hypothetical protein Q8O46_00455 [bacterium]|nr:hypothetical protein [bacterium]
MRKGVVDINVRAKVSNDRINCFTEHIATASDKTPVGKVLENITSPIRTKAKKIRGLDIMGKDIELLKAISDPIFDVGFITNKAIQQKLGGSTWAKGMTGKKLSSRISRHLSLLRAHGLIRKLPNQRKYILTDKGRKITTALNAVLAASTEDLINSVA